MLLQHFSLSLDKKSARYLDLASEGSHSHKTRTEGRKILERILENTSYVTYLIKPLEAISRIKESTTDPKLFDLPIETSPEPSLCPVLVEDQEIHTSTL